MKTMKRVGILLLTFALLLTSSGCGRYVSSYKAVAFVRSNDRDSASMSFYSFEGRMVFKLRSEGEGHLKYSAQLESGSVTVYYDAYGTKEELFSIEGGEEISSEGGYLEKGTVYLIIETDGECSNGSFSVEIAR